MKSRAISEFFSLAKSIFNQNPSDELASALSTLQKFYDEEEKNFEAKDNHELNKTLADLQKKQAEALPKFLQEEKIYQNTVARINAAQKNILQLYLAAYQSGKIGELDDKMIFADLGIVVKYNTPEKECCPTTASTLQKTKERFMADLARQNTYLLTAKLNLKAPERPFQYEIDMAQKAVNQAKQKELDSVTKNTVTAVIDVYNKVSRLKSIAESAENPLRPFMDRITCRERSYAAAWYFHALGTPLRNKLFQAPKAAVQEAKPAEKTASVVFTR